MKKDKAREGGSNVWHALYGLDSSNWEEPNNVYRWVFEDDKNVDVFARAYLSDKYAIEQEKRYRLKSIYFWNTYLLIEDGVRYPFENEDYKGSEHRKVVFTESELEEIDETGFKRDLVEGIE